MHHGLNTNLRPGRAALNPVSQHVRVLESFQKAAQLVTLLILYLALIDCGD
jgi:hypothetical protein